MYRDHVLRVTGRPAKAVIGALGEMGADAIRAAIVKALGKQVATDALPAWLVVETRPLERLVHLAPPLFDAVGADGDEFWSECEAPQLVWSGGKITQRTPGKADKVIALTDAQIASLDAYATDADLVLAAITWHEPAPPTKKQFGALLAAATNAYTGELVAYDPTPPPPSVPAIGGPAIGVTTLGTGRDGRFGATFSSEPKVVWARATGNSSADEWGGSVVVGDGIAVGAKSGFTCKVEAFDATSGKSKWCTETAKTQCWPASAIAIADGTVYMATNHGVHALDAKSGSQRWLARLSQATGAPLVIGDLVVIGAKQGLYALSIGKKGRKAWTFPAKGCAAGAVASRDGILYAHVDTALVALEPDGKSVLWRLSAFEAHSILRAGPATTDASVFYAIDGYTIGCAERANGKPRWQVKLDATIYGHGFAVTGDTFVVRDHEGRLHAFDTAAGKKRWTAEVPHVYGNGHAGPIIARDTVVCVMLEDGPNTPSHLCGFDLATGKAKWRVEPKQVAAAMASEQNKTGSSFDGGWSWYSTPFVADGTLYAQSSAGIVALR